MASCACSGLPAAICSPALAGQGVGTTYRQVVAGPGGRRIDADVEITEFVPDQRIAFRTTKGPVRPTGTYDLRARDGGTELTFHLTVKLSGLKNLISPMVGKTMKAEVAALTQLKRVLEAG
jgi:uncharacterized protein YndB with AHSA1/START domain